MSDPIAKKERSKAKDLRQSPAPEKQKFRKNRKRKKDKPFIVEQKWSQDSVVSSFKPDWINVWSKFGSYATLQEAERVVELQSRKYSFCEFRIKPECLENNEV